ncbi:imidazole glycerol phosphate synthase subunit HisH [Candidatus Daviesbacteria bacterium]|nr:imidazole glycerol phosphate synthase subunit HisH [Candidatus Daviesbacteria bacterium]
MIGVIDYGLGNLTSVKNALDKLGIPVVITSDFKKIRQATALILPGVGAAGEGMKNLKAKKLDKVILGEIVSGKPILGICLGMQLLFEYSEEDSTSCLGLVKGNVKKFNVDLKVPQIGWNQIRIQGRSPQGRTKNVLRSKSRSYINLLSGIPNNSFFYFVNSYYCKPDDKNIITGKTNYGNEFCSVLQKDNIFGVQFHPERSGDNGLKLLKNFWEATR